MRGIPIEFQGTLPVTQLASDFLQKSLEKLTPGVPLCGICVIVLDLNMLPLDRYPEDYLIS